jgi:hypothetical protein
MEWRYAVYAVYVGPQVERAEEDRRGRLGTHLQEVAAPFSAYETQVQVVAQDKLVLLAIDNKGWWVQYSGEGMDVRRVLVQAALH